MSLEYCAYCPEYWWVRELRNERDEREYDLWDEPEYDEEDGYGALVD